MERMKTERHHQMTLVGDEEAQKEDMIAGDAQKVPFRPFSVHYTHM